MSYRLGSATRDRLIKYVPKFYAITYMQEMDSNICESAQVPLITASSADSTGDYWQNISYVPQRTLIDKRDGKSYIIRKLADGNCWMTQNLDLVLSTSKTFNNTDTDLNAKTSWHPSNNTQTTDGVNWQTDANDVSRSFNPNSSVGILYNWHARTADSTNVTTMNENDEAQDSICPYGWRLPYSGTTHTSSKSFEYLYSTIYHITNSNIDKAIGFPFDLQKVGYYGHYHWTGANNKYFSYSSLLSEASVSKYYRLSTANFGPPVNYYPGYGAYYFTIFGNNMNTSGSTYANIGIPVRCVTR